MFLVRDLPGEVSLKQSYIFINYLNPIRQMIIQGPVIAVLVFFCTAFMMMALRKSAASRASESDSENSL